MEELTNNVESNNEMRLTRPSMLYLNETGKWGKFLSILGFCGVGIMVIFSMFAGTIFSELDNGQMPFPTFFVTVLYLLMAALYFFPILFLYKFSTKIRTALIAKDSEQLVSAFENLKSHYKFIGIFAAVVLILYALIFIGAMLVGSMF